MAFVLRVGSLLPIAVRVLVTGGAAYGSVRVGVWEDSSKSRETLENWRRSLRDMREIEYPSDSPLSAALSQPRTDARLHARAVYWWNTAVKRAFQFIIGSPTSSPSGNTKPNS